MAAIFNHFGFAYTRDGSGDAETFSVVPPSYRFDLKLEEDLMEEVGPRLSSSTCQRLRARHTMTQLQNNNI